MTDEEWTDWIEHDGTGMPIPRGVIAEVEWADGTSVVAMNNGQSAASAGVTSWHQYRGPTYSSSWIWCGSGSKIPVRRYRIRRPRALQQLRELAENPKQEVEA